MFVDSVELMITSGKGGAGSISFWTEKFVANGGPDGGDGGRGGSVFFKVDNNTDTLSGLRGRVHMKAENGQPGAGSKCYGRKGKDMIITVPPGTTVVDMETGEELMDLVTEGDVILFLEGGKGGLGNMHFKSSSNQRPTYAQPGLPGVSKKVRLEMKLIADVGLVGYPNVGKSTLIATLSNARPQVANYEFTTLTPKLGVVHISDYDSFMMADIPGIIEGASDGRGLGLEFLKHIERTKFLLFMLDMANYRPLEEQYRVLKEEIAKFSGKLKDRHYAIALTRVDAASVDDVNERIEEFIGALDKKVDKKDNIYKFLDQYPIYIQDIDAYDTNEPFFIAPISSVVHQNIDPLKYALLEVVTSIKEDEGD